MRRALWSGCCALLLATAAGAGDDAATGRRIFVTGGAADEVIASFAGSNTRLAPRLRRCAGCHGRDGAGGREGGITMPPISWRALTAPREATSAQPGRPLYDDALLVRALGTGIDSAGRPLAPGMPRFQLTPAQAAALLDHLRIVGTDRDLDPGVTPGEISIGAVLPLSGPAAPWGRAMRDGLERALNAAGPIYGRRLQLVTADAGSDAVAAWRSLVAGGRVFALAGTMLPAEAGRETDDVPVIAPLRPAIAHDASNLFHLLAPVEDQMRVLLDELAAEIGHPMQLIVVGPDGAAADAVTDQARRHGATVLRRAQVDNLAALLPPAPAASPDAIVVLPDADFGRLAAGLAEQPGSFLLAGAAEAVAPEIATDDRLRLVLPIGPGGTAASAAPPLASAAAAVLAEALKRMGARVSRAGLITAIESLRDFHTDVLPPLDFDRGQHVGSHASIVVRPDRSRGMTTLGGWRTPR